jgi:hypothetical protein
MKFERTVTETYAVHRPGESIRHAALLSIRLTAEAKDGDRARPILDEAVAEVLKRSPANLVRRDVTPIYRTHEGCISTVTDDESRLTDEGNPHEPRE